MDDKTRGAWLVHHAQKLQNVTGGAAVEFEKIGVAGKMGLLLSSLAATEESTLPTAKVEALAKASAISVTFELPLLLERLEAHSLISRSSHGVGVLGVTTGSVLQHTSTAFENLTPSPSERAVIDFAERVSLAPLDSSLATEYIGDMYKLSDADAADLLAQTEDVGFVDAESVGRDQKLYFNGNLFRRESASKIHAVLASLSSDESRLVQEVDVLLKAKGCLSHERVEEILTEPLFKKLHAIGMYDVSEVSNQTERMLYVTRPSAFHKFSDALVDDAMDLAKAFVTSLTYGRTRSASSRGRIQALSALMRRLLTGDWIGPATAIGQDYQILELRRVIELQHSHDGRYYMRLLKKDIGELALQVLMDGDASEHSLPNFPGAAVSGYISPEVKRAAVRKKQTKMSKRGTTDVLTALRTEKL